MTGTNPQATASFRLFTMPAWLTANSERSFQLASANTSRKVGVPDRSGLRLEVCAVSSST